jgi:hypothetical protein
LEPNISNDPTLQWAATLPAQPIRPQRNQFTIRGQPLFPECEAYLGLAEHLVEKARAISYAVHGANHLTLVGHQGSTWKRAFVNGRFAPDSATDSFQSLLMVFLLLAEDCAADPRKRSFVAPARIAPLN